MVESFSDEILAGADTSDVALLVVGDPFGCRVLSLPLHAGGNILIFC